MGQRASKPVPAPGDPWYATYTYDPLNAPFSPPPTGVAGVTLDPARASLPPGVAAQSGVVPPPRPPHPRRRRPISVTSP